MATAQQEKRFGVDLITFYDPQFWSVADWQELADRAARDPRWFWDRTLESVRAASITGIELTFPPGNWENAKAAYGSLDGFAAALEARGICVTSSYFSGIEHSADIADPAEQTKILRAASEEAKLLRACGADVLVSGLPMRPSPGSGMFIDLDYAKLLADLVNRMGAATQAEGVRLALHTEMDSVFCLPRDIELMMLLTDPEYVGICPDTAHIILPGGDPVGVLDHYFERVAITHWKDVTGPLAMPRSTADRSYHSVSPFFRAIGDGVVDWARWAGRLRDGAFSGWNILEIDEAADPLTQITAAREFAEKVVDVVAAR